jgi:peptidoglycan/LPS O-acetylase OafA/YrhL
VQRAAPIGKLTFREETPASPDTEVRGVPAVPIRDGLASALARPTLPSIDGLRAIAVFLVIFYHLGVPRVNGGLGVLMFFVISGFLITWLLLKEERRWGNISLKLFYTRRTLRIFPAFYCYWLLVTVGFALVGRHVVWPQALASLFYVNNYYQAIAGDPNTALSHTWSLGIEEQFYLLWPVSFLVLRTNARRIRALAVIIGLVWIYRLSLVTLFDVPQDYIYEALDTRADHLLVGCLLATLLFERPRVTAWRALTAGRGGALWVTLGLLGASSIVATSAGAAYRDTVGFIVDPLLTAALIVQALTLSATSAAWLNRGWVSYLGRISYSLYLYQQIAMEPAKKALAHFPFAVQIGGAIVAVVVAASLSYYVIEKPFLALKERWGKRKMDPAAAQAMRL